MVDAAHARVVVVLTRAPSAAGKTRLFAALECAPDPRLLEALLLDTLDGARAPGVRQVVAVTPAAACDDVRALVGSQIEVFAQSDGDLGTRMRAAMARALAEGAAAVALVGSDLPHITPEHVAAAFEALDRDPGSVVLGPSVDGGYYLVAATQVPPLFEGIAWSTPDVFAQTLAAARAGGVRVHAIAPLEDVDTPAALVAAAGAPGAVRTAAWLRGRTGPDHN